MSVFNWLLLSGIFTYKMNRNFVMFHTCLTIHKKVWFDIVVLRSLKGIILKRKKTMSITILGLAINKLCTYKIMYLKNVKNVQHFKYIYFKYIRYISTCSLCHNRVYCTIYNHLFHIDNFFRIKEKHYKCRILQFIFNS